MAVPAWVLLLSTLMNVVMSLDWLYASLVLRRKSERQYNAGYGHSLSVVKESVKRWHAQSDDNRHMQRAYENVQYLLDELLDGH